MKHIDVDVPLDDLEPYLKSNDWLQPGEHLLSLEKPGEGNMNVLVRAKTNQRTFILKQSRPYVEKFKQVEAPIDRIAVEHQFYRALKTGAITAHMPRILGYDAQNYLLMLEDLGQCEDMTSVYKLREIHAEQVETLVSILAMIHRTKAPKNFPDNHRMRQLNHQHIFVLPFLENNGFLLDDVQIGLQQLSLRYKSDPVLKTVVASVGERYLSQGEILLHGDYYPGSWMTAGDRIYVIDPEFGFVGFKEFDLGVMAAHLIMATADKAHLETLVRWYGGNIDETLLAQVAGIEIMRRLLGLAQLPLERTLEEKDYLLRTAYKLILR